MKERERESKGRQKKTYLPHSVTRSLGSNDLQSLRSSIPPLTDRREFLGQAELKRSPLLLWELRSGDWGAVRGGKSMVKERGGGDRGGCQVSSLGLSSRTGTHYYSH